jgi:tetratricopeptide (TPR) repeat protein
MKLASCVSLALCVAMVGVGAAPSAAQEAESAAKSVAAPASGAGEVSRPPAASEGAISEAEQHFRKGVELYNGNLYLEALSEFNRVLALDPQMEKAKAYREKCNGKLQIGAAGGDPTAVPAFETLDSQSVTTDTETPQLSAEEMKVKKVAELLKAGKRCLDNERYSRAVKIFEEVLLIAPDNVSAQEGLHQATIGASKDAAAKSQEKVEEDKGAIRRYIDDSKQLPQGADAMGIKPYRITVPVIEEEYAEPHRKSVIETILDSPVGIEFENIRFGCTASTTLSNGKS